MSEESKDVNENAGHPSAASACSAYRPKDQQWLQEMCELVRNKMPATHTFVVFAFPVHTTDRCYYASNAERASAIEALKEWIAYQDKVDNWMKHDSGPPPPPPWPKTAPTGSAACAKCGRSLVFIRDRNFPDGSGKVWMCENPQCESFQLYVYPKPPNDL